MDASTDFGFEKEKASKLGFCSALRGFLRMLDAFWPMPSSAIAFVSGLAAGSKGVAGDGLVRKLE